MCEGPGKRLKLERGLVPLLVQRADKIPGDGQLPTQVMAHPQDSVLRLKEIIAEAFGEDFAASPVKVLFKGKPLREERSGVEQTLHDYGIRGNALLLLKDAVWLPNNTTRLKYSDSCTRSHAGRGHTGASTLLRSTQALVCSDEFMS